VFEKGSGKLVEKKIGVKPAERWVLVLPVLCLVAVAM